MSHQTTRRSFLQASVGYLGAGLAVPTLIAARSPNERVRLGGIGVGGRGWTDFLAAANFGDVVAFCDVDTGKDRRGGGYGGAAEKWPAARRYTDFRKMLEAERGKLDGVTISTPDHMHAPITLMAMQHGLAVYTQKPLTRTVAEARALRDAAAKYNVSTQMGNQHHSSAGYRNIVAIVQQGTIGKVRQAHTWTNRPGWPQGIGRPAGGDPVPESLDWNLWLGGAPPRPYKKEAYHPFNWRGWFDFGAGALGDMGCHIIDPVVASLKLGPPDFVSYEGPTPMEEAFPTWEILTYRFPGTSFTAGDAFTLKWYDGGRFPTVEGSHVPEASELPAQGVMLIGDKGTLVCPHGKGPKLYPVERFADLKPPIETDENHYGLWIDGIRTGSTPNSNFAYAAPLTETVLVGVIASRVGKADLSWDSANMQFKNSDKANRYIQAEYRAGWMPG